MFTFISLSSLAVGLACAVLLLTYGIHEFTIESGNPAKDRIVYMAQDSPMTSGERVSYVVGDIPVSLKEKYPEIEDCLRFNIEEGRYMLVEGQKQAARTIVTADPSFLRFFPYEVIAGKLEEALTEPHKIALSERCARQLFGDGPALGKTLSVKPAYDDGNGEEGENGSPFRSYQVVAILKDRAQSFLQFDALAANGPDFNGGVTLLLTAPGFDAEAFAQKIKADGVPTLLNDLGRYYFYSLQESYFQRYPQEYIPYIPRNNRVLIYVGLASAFLILLIACFNYVNLNFSRILQQIRMIHIQKLAGASPGDTNRQLFADTFLTVLTAFFLALLLTCRLLPLFNGIVSGRMEASFFFSGQVLPALGGLVLLLALAPAAYMSRKIAGLSQTRYRMFFTGNKKRRIVTVLTIAQFAISIGLVFATLVVRDQLRLIREGGERYRDLIEIGDWTGSYRASMDVFAKELRRYPEVGEVTLSKGSLIHFGLRQIVLPEKGGGETYYSLGQFGGDTTFFRTLRLSVVQGLPPVGALDAFEQPVYINQQYAQILIPPGENPVGKPLRTYDADFARMEQAEQTGQTGQEPVVIAGIVENMYTETLENEAIPALVYLFDRGPYDYILLRLPSEGKQKALARVGEIAEKIYPAEYFTYQDIYDTFLSYNRQTLELAELLRMYSLISLLLTASGLFGMAFYAIGQRTKEIGIRKVNGATTGQILYLLNRQFIGWVAIAFAAAVPLTGYGLEKWLEHFAYRTEITWEMPLAAGLLVAGVALLTVSGLSYRAASANPAKALRSE